MAEQGSSTVSSEELAEAAGVNSAKVRKDLSHLGTYGTRGVGSAAGRGTAARGWAGRRGRGGGGGGGRREERRRRGRAGAAGRAGGGGGERRPGGVAVGRGGLQTTPDRSEDTSFAHPAEGV